MIYTCTHAKKCWDAEKEQSRVCACLSFGNASSSRPLYPRRYIGDARSVRTQHSRSTVPVFRTACPFLGRRCRHTNGVSTIGRKRAPRPVTASRHLCIASLPFPRTAFRNVRIVRLRCGHDGCLSSQLYRRRVSPKTTGHYLQGPPFYPCFRRRKKNAIRHGSFVHIVPTTHHAFAMRRRKMSANAPR